MARIVVAGYIIRYPLGGNVWAHFQYLLGLARLGHDVWFVEEAGWADSCYDPEHDVMTSDPTAGIRCLEGLLDAFGLTGRWAYHDSAGRWHGLPEERVTALVRTADLFLDVGGTARFPQMRYARRRAYVDMDPGFTQFRTFGATAYLDEYDVLFTYGGNIGRPGCPIPTLGFTWHPLRPPVVLDVWQPSARVRRRLSWTTVASWSAYGACTYEGEVYGQKDVEFRRFIDLPNCVPARLEVAVAGEGVPVARLKEGGWHVVDSLAASRDPWQYRAYIWGSHAEFSVAKNAYVKTASGWVSDRTATYLAAGRPAVVQDTGTDLPVGGGLLVFSTMGTAVAALAAVDAHYARHSRAARVLAAQHFDSRRVLGGLLHTCGL